MQKALLNHGDVHSPMQWSDMYRIVDHSTRTILLPFSLNQTGVPGASRDNLLMVDYSSPESNTLTNIVTSPEKPYPVLVQRSVSRICVESPGLGTDTTPISPHVPVTVICAALCTKQLLLSREVGVVPAHLVAVFLGLQHRCQVDAAPHLFTGEFMLLALTHKDLAPTVGHDQADSEEVVCWFKAAGRYVALSCCEEEVEVSQAFKSVASGVAFPVAGKGKKGWKYLVLYGVIAAYRREVLGHGCREVAVSSGWRVL